jgi:hypothetical protein
VLKTLPNKHLCQQPHFPENVLQSETARFVRHVQIITDMHVCDNCGGVEDAKVKRISVEVRNRNSRLMQD